MGAWGYGIFEDDLADDIRQDFEEALEEGMSIPEATERILESYEYLNDDEDDGPTLYLALASLQADRKALQPEMRERALAIINNGEGLDRWDDEESLAERKKVLEELKAQILSV